MAKRLRVLVVEDEFLIAMETEYLIEQAGHAVVGTAVDSRAALALAAEHEPDLALVDLNLRDGFTGPEVGIRLAREHGVAVVFVTANPSLAPVGVSGVMGIIAKPFTSEEFVSALRVLATRLTGDASDGPGR